MKLKVLITLALLPLPFGACAAPPETSLRPSARAETGAPAPGAERQERRGLGLGRVLRPKQRGEGVRIFASKRQRAIRRGMVCGDPSIQGETVGRVPGKINGCGVNDAVRLRSVAGVTLSQRAVVDCGTAKALKTWVETGMKPALGQRGGGASQIRVAAHYACRTRNSKTGAKISEHGKGRAIDVAGVRLKDGSEINVLNHWGRGWRGRALKQMHARACGPFGTVLGPAADRYHRDHFHFDTARYRAGTYCR